MKEETSIPVLELLMRYLCFSVLHCRIQHSLVDLVAVVYVYTLALFTYPVFEITLNFLCAAEQ